MTLSDYHAEHTALTTKIERIQAEQTRVRVEAEERLQQLQRDLSAALTRREQVRGAIEALTQ